MKPFKFFKTNTLLEMNLEMLSREVRIAVRGPEHIPAGYILPYRQQTEDELYMEVEDVNNGETFGIPFRMSEEISGLGVRLFREGRTVSGRCEYNPYEYWVDNVYFTTNSTLIVEVIISIPMGNGRSKIRRIRQIIPYS